MTTRRLHAPRGALVVFTALLWAGAAWAAGKTAFVAGYTLTPGTVAAPADVNGLWRDQNATVFVTMLPVEKEVRGLLVDTVTGERIVFRGTVADGAVAATSGPEAECAKGAAATGTVTVRTNKTQAGAVILTVERPGKTVEVEQIGSKVTGKQATQLSNDASYCN